MRKNEDRAITDENTPSPFMIDNYKNTTGVLQFIRELRAGEDNGNSGIYSNTTGRYNSNEGNVGDNKDDQTTGGATLVEFDNSSKGIHGGIHVTKNNDNYERNTGDVGVTTNTILMGW